MTNRSRRGRRDKYRRKEDNFIIINDLNLIKPYASYDVCIEDYISRFGFNDVIVYNKNIGFALLGYNDFCPMDIQNDPYCLDFVYINEDQRGKGKGKRLMKFILKHFQIVLHTYNSSLGFFGHISEELGLEKIKNGTLFGKSFISSNLSVNRQPVVNKCIGGCGQKFKGYKRHICSKCSVNFMMNVDKKMIELKNSLRLKLKKKNQTTVFNIITPEHFTEMMVSNVSSDFKKAVISDVFMNM